jgi:UDP-N-acetylglucosamine diphosphorylase / glucose-1-phosphate thymidylyltransferase / UDP-N-acetylgalactosamine diphosphorylase / glucosamine-1-phosphate N-acetyltransferase / galactosamine-1-phosphate N-acetyltransferase
MHLVVFENSNWPSLAPLSFSRPTFAMICGTGTLLEKQVRFHAPTRLTLWVRPELADHCRRHIVPTLLIPGLIESVRINEPLDAQPAALVDGSALCLATSSISPQPCVAVAAGTSRIVQATITAPGLSHLDALHDSPRWKANLDLPRIAPMAKPVTYLWDLLGFNDEALVSDATSFQVASQKPTDGPWHLINTDQIFISRDVNIGPGCVLDASKGPVMLASGSVIGANSVLQGPCYIGAKSEITPLSLIRAGTSIGPSCKIGGEVARAIVIGYSNKAHEGYLGDSYLGEWVNLGAGTTTSNLKNTYGEISMNLGTGEIDTGRKFLGSIIGDHTKTAISTRFMSGSYVGFCSMIATSAHAPRFTPSFKFCTDRGAEAYRLDKAFDVARAMFARRNRPWTDEDEELMRYAAGSTREAECPV